jgi:hypothetical protein
MFGDLRREAGGSSGRGRLGFAPQIFVVFLADYNT